MSKISKYGPGFDRPVRYIAKMAHDTPCKICPRIVRKGGPGFWGPNIGGVHVECDKINRDWWKPYAERSGWKW